jgi:hypothetical protein
VPKISVSVGCFDIMLTLPGSLSLRNNQCQHLQGMSGRRNSSFAPDQFAVVICGDVGSGLSVLLFVLGMGGVSVGCQPVCASVGVLAGASVGVL